MDDQTKNATLSMREAVFIVGHNPSDSHNLFTGDWDARHIGPVSCFQSEAEALVDCLEDPEVLAAVKQYDHHNAKSIDAQNRYLSARKWIGVTFALALTLSVFATLFTPRFIGRLVGWLGDWFDYDPRETGLAVEANWQLYVGWFVLLALALPPLLTWLRRPHRHFVDWKKSRATAERMRQEIFNRIMNYRLPNGSASNAANLLVLKLEHFRRWQLQVQNAYFNIRGQQKKKLSQRPSTFYTAYSVLGAVLFLMILLASFAGTDEQGVVGPDITAPYHSGSLAVAANLLTWHADRILFGVIVLVLCLSALAWHAAELGNAWVLSSRYETMAANYDDLFANHLPEARAAAQRGDEAAVRNFVERVHGMMQIEFNEWVHLSELEAGKMHAAKRSPAATGISQSS